MRRDLVDLLAVAGHDGRVAVLVGADDRADGRQFVPHLRLEREVLADLDAGHVALDRFEFAAELHGRVRLHVVQIEMRRATGQGRS